MSLSDEQATLLLERLADTVSEGPAPVETLVARGRARRARGRQRVTLALGSVAAITATTTISAIDISREPDSPAPLVDTNPAPVPPPGTRYVGRGRVVVAVPDGWTSSTLTSECGPTSSLYVTFEPRSRAIRGCPLVASPKEPVSGVTIGRGGGTETTVDDQLGIHNEIVCVDRSRQICDVRLVVPSERVTFALHAEGFTANDVLLSIVDSVRLLPEGWITVPDASTAGHVVPTITDAKAQLSAAGLQAVVEVVHSTLFDGAVLSSDPAMGYVIAEGGTVTLQVSDGPDK